MSPTETAARIATLEKAHLDLRFKVEGGLNAPATVSIMEAAALIGGVGRAWMKARIDEGTIVCIGGRIPRSQLTKFL